jgi:oligopeptide/dipeptide ABC transporter ATP-binding protein
LALGPDLVIADEPVTALDVSIQAQIVNLLADIQAASGVAYLVIAHDLALVHHIADRVLVMYLGRVVEEGPIDLLAAEPQHPYTAALLSATPVPDRDRRQQRIVLRGDPPSAIDRPTGCAFHPRCPIARPHCAEDSPDLVDIGAGRRVACFYPGEIGPVLNLHRPARPDDSSEEVACLPSA